MPSTMWTSLATGALLVAAGAAAGQEQPAAGEPPAAAPSVTATTAPSEAPAPRINPFGARPVDLVSLSAKRGGAGVLNDMKLKGVVADNQASQLTTGNNVLSDGAFSGSVGLPMVIQNSGNNVLIQNATIVNVQVK